MIHDNRKWISGLFGMLMFASSLSQAEVSNTLQEQRKKTIEKYVTLMGQGEYQTIPTLFAPDARAISSSGIPDQPVHFYKTLFTKTISQPRSQLENILEGKLEPNVFAGCFLFSWKNTHGKQVAAKFLDLFVFMPDSDKIKTLYVFSNTFQDDIMKQLQK